MKKSTHTLLPLAAALYACTMTNGFADPQLDSWLTENSGKYSRIYKRQSNYTPDLTTTYTTWGSGTSTAQDDPVYADVQRVQYSTSSVYVEASGLTSYVMGPWYKPNGTEYLNWPQNQQMIFRIPRTTSVGTVPRDRLAAGYSGVFVNGMAAYGPLDGKAWADTEEASGQHTTNESEYYWFELAPVEEAFNFDAGNGHQPPTGIYHAHQSPIALRYQLGDHVDYDLATNTYTEKSGLPATHSPIVGWAKDGYPVYGPYGYDDPTDTASGIRRMVSGFVIRDGANGSDDVSSNRSIIPAWYARFRDEQNVDATYSTDTSAASYGTRPTMATKALGTFAQDYSYLGDLTNPTDSQVHVQGEDFDLNAQNCRWCITPEFPSGTYAYFITLDATQTPTFPYTFGFEYYGDTSNQYGSVSSISESVTTHYVGGPNASLDLNTPSVDGADEVTLTWNIVEGGTYTVDSSPDDSYWMNETTIVANETTAGSTTFTGNGGDGYARVTRSSIATYDEALNTVPSSTQTDTEAYSTPASVVYVNAARTGLGTQTGASWATAFADLQDALATAATGQEIWVAAGLYYPDEAEGGMAMVTNNDENIRFVLPSGIPIYGGFNGTETGRSARDWKTNLTILSGDIDQDDTNTNGVILSDPSANLSGTNSKSVIVGTADLTGVLDGVVITAANGGVGAIVAGGSFRNCTIQGNKGSFSGALHQEGELFSFVFCDILNNEGSNVGAISAYGLSGAQIVSCKIQGNLATNTNSSISVGAIHSGQGDLQITNCLISGNSGNNNGAIVQRTSGTLRIDNTTIAHNLARSSASVYDEAGGVGMASGTTNYYDNVLVWGNQKNGVSDNVSGSYSSDESLIEGDSSSSLDGTDVANDPLFMSPVAASSAPTSSGDYRLPGTSPAVDSGDAIENPNDDADLDEDGNTGEVLPVDLVGNDREIDETDIGAYEYTGPTVATAITSNVEVELGANGTVDAVNLDSLFGGDYSYSAVVATSGVFTTYDANDTTGMFEVTGPFGAVGSTTLVTITATDSDGYLTSTSFTIEITETYIPADSLSQSIGSWYTDRSSRFARIYKEYDDETNQTPVTTWDSGSTSQDVPVYGGPQEISYTDSFVFVKTPSLSTHTMGPWYRSLDGGGEAISTNWPANQDYTYKLPRVPSIPTTKTDFPGGSIGLMVDGTVIYSSSDAYSWDNNEDGTGAGVDTGPGNAGTGFGDNIWLHEAVVTEGDTFDQSNAHGAGERLHYHGNPTGLRYLLGDNMAYDESTNIYTPVMQGDAAYNNTHSPIIGWMNDGFPLYGPFGYSDPTDPDGDVRRMVSGFIKRDGTGGSYDVTTSGRDRLPDWVADARGVSAALTINEQGPDVDTDYPVGYFMEDYDYKGDLAAFSYYEGVGEFDDAQHYDLNQYNVRFCVTPEFPDGTWAYFTNVDATGTVVFPNNVAQQYFGDPSEGGTVMAIPADDGTETQTFIGGASIVESIKSSGVDSGDITLTWSVVEGGTYLIESTTDLNTWGDELTDQVADSEILSVVETMTETSKFYRISRTAEPVYDGSGGGGGSVSFDFTFGSSPPLPPQGAISSASVGGVTATIVSYDQGTGAITLSFDNTTLSSGAHTGQVAFTPPMGSEEIRTSTNSYTK